ncbi:MAG TPA: HEAT repeat domain-containing protein [Candidatus Anammoximicrobium sp.]|nr:HEAT repeat domain-containing protein [Candidatus Anammoximicrobium sp.]
MRFVWKPILCLFVLGAVRTAQGAVFLLVTGGQIEGQLLNPQENPRQSYIVRTETGGTVKLALSQVDRVLTVSEDLAWYREALPKVPPTVDGHWAMAEECRRRSLKQQREFHLQEILKLDPEHAEARYGLGYSKLDGNWVKTDEWMLSRGYVRYRGAWRIAQDVALEQVAQRNEKQVKDWRQKVNIWRTAISKRRGKEQDATDAIRAIKDPAAAPALAEIVGDTDEQRDLRLLCIEVLGKLQSPAGVAAFIKQAVEDADPHIREACLDQLARFGTPQAVRICERLLKSKDNRKVNQAALCLGALKDPAATLPLINALVTEHKFVVQSPGGSPGQMNLGFGSGPSGGGNSFSAGGRPQVITKNLRNEGALNALVAIHPGVNFGYDIEQWKRWYVDKDRPTVFDLRRDF